MTLEDVAQSLPVAAKPERSRPYSKKRIRPRTERTSKKQLRSRKQNEPSRVYRSRLVRPWEKKELKLPKRSSRLFFSGHLSALLASLGKSDGDSLLSAFYSPGALLAGLQRFVLSLVHRTFDALLGRLPIFSWHCMDLHEVGCNIPAKELLSVKARQDPSGLGTGGLGSNRLWCSLVAHIPRAKVFYTDRRPLIN